VSIVVAIVRDDFIHVISDSRATTIDGQVANEDTTKIIKLHDDVVMATMGRIVTISSIKSQMKFAIQDMWPNKPITTNDYSNIIEPIVNEMRSNKAISTDRDRVAIIMLAGKNREGKFELRIFYTNPDIEHSIEIGTQSAQVYVLPPVGSSEDDYGREFLASLNQENQCTNRPLKERVARAGIAAIQKLASQNPNINNKCQIYTLP